MLALLLTLATSVGLVLPVSAAAAAVPPGWFEITGTVVTDGPAQGFGVGVIGFTPGASGGGSVQTDSSGWFQLAVAPGVYSIQVGHVSGLANDPGWTRTYLGDVAFLSQAALVAVDSNVNVGTIHMVRGGSVSGTITLPDGVDQYDVTVSCYSWDALEGVWTAGSSIVPGFDGTYQVIQVPPGPTLVRVSAAALDVDVQTQYVDGAAAWWDSSAVTVVAGSDTAVGGIDMVEGTRQVDRLGGADRFSMAVGVSQHGYPSVDIPVAGVDVVYVANGFKFPDALSAGPAAAGHGPVLLLPADGIPQVVHDELLRLDPQRIVITGGPASISAATETALAAIAPTSRIGGADRYEASRSIALQEFGTATIAIITTGAKFPDALAVGPFAGSRGAPVILVAPGDSLDEATSDLLVELGVQSVYVAGGPASVSTGIEWDLWSVPGVERVWRMSGQDRYEAAGEFARQVGNPADSVMVAYGGNFPDALAGAWLGGYLGDGIVLAQKDCIPGQSTLALTYGASMVLLGGPNSLSPAIEDLTICP